MWFLCPPAQHHLVEHACPLALFKLALHLLIILHLSLGCVTTPTSHMPIFDDWGAAWFHNILRHRFGIWFFFEPQSQKVTHMATPPLPPCVVMQPR